MEKQFVTVTKKTILGKPKEVGIAPITRTMIKEHSDKSVTYHLFSQRRLGQLVLQGMTEEEAFQVMFKRIREIDFMKKGKTPEEAKELAEKLKSVEDDEFICADFKDIPKDKTFRNAFELNKKDRCVEINMAKARNIKMEMIRYKRNEKLKQLDAPMLIAQEQNDTNKVRELAAEKQALRDLPASVNLEALTTPEELKDFVPRELKD